MDQRAHWSRTLHGVGQPDVQRELPGLGSGAAKDQERNESPDCGTCAKHIETGAFKASAPAIVEEQCATAIVQPEHAEKKSHVADPRGDERLLCSRRGARSVDPEADKQIRREPNEFPENEKKEKNVRHDQTEHSASKERQILKEAGDMIDVR